MKEAPTTDRDGEVEQPALHHVMIVGGTLVEWGLLTDEQWHDRITALGTLSRVAGATWLTLRPFERGEGADAARHVHHSVLNLDGCSIIVDPTPDGRERLVVALRKLAETDQLSEPEVAAALLAPATTEPDLVMVLGPRDRLPSSLVWELAYSELVYVAVTWADLATEHLVTAIDAYHHRHRRFGGLD